MTYGDAKNILKSRANPKIKNIILMIKNYSLWHPFKDYLQ